MSTSNAPPVANSGILRPGAQEPIEPAPHTPVRDWANQADRLQEKLQRHLEKRRAQEEAHARAHGADHKRPDKAKPSRPDRLPLPGTLRLSDVGNARRLVARHGPDLHYVPAWRRWLVWDGTRWESDTAGRVERLATDVTAEIFRAAVHLELSYVRSWFWTHA